jgi:hypothetical protein
MANWVSIVEREDFRHASSWMSNRARQTLLATQGVVGLMAAVCGPGLIVTDGLGMPRSALDETPFHSFLIPGIVLGVVVGGSLLASTYMVWRNRRGARRAAIASSVVLLGWISVEAVLIHGGRPLQLVIFAAAFAMVALALRTPRRAVQMPD